MTNCLIKWHKCDSRAIIPTKKPQAAGFDIYTIEKNITIEPFSQHLFSTGLQVAIEEGYWLAVWDRGSTGSKGLHVHCGVVDNDYRGEIFICIKNDNPYPVKFTDDEEPGIHSHIVKASSVPEDNMLAIYMTKEVDFIDYLVYPCSKAIAQLIPMLQPLVSDSEATEEEWEYLKNTERGEGKLGSSGK